MILSDQYDPMGQAIWDYATLGNAQHHLIVQSSLFDDDEMPIETLFRKESHMSRIERTALNLCKGRILDVGAGAGCHTLLLLTFHLFLPKHAPYMVPGIAFVLTSLQHRLTSSLIPSYY